MHWLSHRIALLRKLESATKLFTSGKRVLANSICVIKPWLRIRRHMVVNSRGHFCKILKIRSTILPFCSVLHYPSPGINPLPPPLPSHTLPRPTFTIRNFVPPTYQLSNRFQNFAGIHIFANYSVRGAWKTWLSKNCECNIQLYFDHATFNHCHVCTCIYISA